MRNEGGEVHPHTDEARAGSTPHVVRWVLGIGLIAVIVAFTIIVLIGAGSQSESEEHQNVNRMIDDRQDEDRSDIDGVVSQEADEFAPDAPADVIESTEDGANRTIAN